MAERVDAVGEVRTALLGRLEVRSALALLLLDDAAQLDLVELHHVLCGCALGHLLRQRGQVVIERLHLLLHAHHLGLQRRSARLALRAQERELRPRRLDGFRLGRELGREILVPLLRLGADVIDLLDHHVAQRGERLAQPVHLMHDDRCYQQCAAGRRGPA